MHDNICGLTVNTAIAPTGTVGSLISGVGVGISQAGQASTNAFGESKTGERDSLLKAIELLFKAEKAQEKDPLALDLFPEALRDVLASIRKGAAMTVNKLLISPVTIGSHVSQLPIDVAAALSGLSNSIQDYQKLLQTGQASTLDVDKELQEKKSGLFANCQALHHHCSEIHKELKKEIAGQFEHKGSARDFHESLAKTTGGVSMTAGLATAGVVSLVVDLIGSAFREISGFVEFSKMESHSVGEQNIYQALSHCCASFSQSKDSKESFLALQQLEKAISNFDNANNMNRDHSLSGPSISAFTRMLTAAPFVKTLTAVNASYLGLLESSNAQDNEKSAQLSRDSVARASLIRDFSGGDALNHCQNVADFCKHFDDVIKHIDQQLEAKPNHEVVQSSAKSSVRTQQALVTAASLIPGFSGLIMREFSGSTDFSQNDKGSREESALVLQTREQMTGNDLDKLMSRVCALQDRIARCHELGVSAPVVLGVGQAISSGAVIAALNVVAGMVSALKEIRTFSQSPNNATQLDDAEQLKAQGMVQSVIGTNKDSAKSTGVESASENRISHQPLQSVMEKVVLTYRASRNPLNFAPDRQDINSTGKSSIGFSQDNCTGFLMGALGVTALAALQSGLGVEVLLGASVYSTQVRRASDGVDNLVLSNESKTNSSFVSNITRVLEDRIKSTAIKSTSRATYLVDEVLLSRSLTVALCHNGALTEVLRRLVQEEYEKLNPVEGQLDSALVSDALMPRLHDAILKVLDDAEVGKNPIPKLNNDMASNLASASNASIASVLASQSVFISPILKSIVVAKKASIIGEKQYNEALIDSEVSRILSTALNALQGFSINSIDELKAFKNPIHNSAVIRSSEEVNNWTMMATCAVSLLCEELFELCMSRSLTLLDKNKVEQTKVKSSEQTKVDANLSTEAVKEDSGLGQDYSLTHGLSAVRLTLSRLGVSLGDLASKLEASPKLLEDNLQMHSSQQSFIKTLVPVLGEFSQLMLGLSAGLSVFPMSTAGLIDDLRNTLHTTDHHLRLQPVHSSAKSTKHCGSESSLLTGVVTDCATSLLTAATKFLLQASVLGLDTTLSMAKIMEILTLHQRPLEALVLETQGLSQPNGITNNTNQMAQNFSVLSTLGLASAVIGSKTDSCQSTQNSLQVLQKAIDNRIDEVSLLKDEEEDEKTLGLKVFYQLLVRFIHGGKSNDDYEYIVKRFDLGGIRLSNYHSAHGGIKGGSRERNTTRLINEYGFQNCDDAAGLLALFIRKAVIDERNSLPHLLNSLKDALVGQKLSSKVEERWTYIVSMVIDQLKAENSRRSIFRPGDARPNLRKWEDRRTDLLSVTNPEVREKEVLIVTI